MSSSIFYRHYEVGDEEQIVGLLQQAFPKWLSLKHPIENWVWKYQRTPSGSNVIVCEDRGKIIGVMHEIKLKIKIRGSVYTCSYGDDVAVSTDYRGKGIYDHLRKQAREDDIKNEVEIRYSATENKIIENYSIKVGDKPMPFQLAHLIRVESIDEFLKEKGCNTLNMRIKMRGVKTLNNLLTLKTNSKKIDGIELIEKTKFDDSFNSFWDKAQTEFDYIIEKNNEYLNWKINKPGRKYVIKTAVENDEILGYIILGISENEKYREGVIIDILSKPGRLEISDLLIKDACKYFDAQNTLFSYYAATIGHKYKSIAIQHGFLDASSEKHTKFFYHVYNPNIENDFLGTINPNKVQLNYY